MKVTFKRKNLSISCNCELMSKTENRILTSFHLKTSDMTIPDMFTDLLEGTNDVEQIDRILINEDDDGVEFKILTCKVEKHENYAIFRINCN